MDVVSRSINCPEIIGKKYPAPTLRDENGIKAYDRMELRHSRNMVGTSTTETKNKRNAREDVLEKLIKRRRRIGSSPRLSEEISRKTANNDSSQLQYFHDWTRRSSGWTAGIRDYVIVGRREQIWAERERGGDLPRSNRSPLGNSGPDT